jgi:cell division protein FtsW (lipid II flippase)
MKIKYYIELLRRMDWLLFAAMVLLAVASVLFIYSASYHGPGQPIKDFYRMQMVWFGVGLLIYLAVSLVDYRLICQWATVWYVIAWDCSCWFWWPAKVTGRAGGWDGMVSGFNPRKSRSWRRFWRFRIICSITRSNRGGN